MIKKLAVRMYNGFAITVFVDLIVHFIIARTVGSCVTPEFAARFTNEASATLVQLMLVALIGMAFAAAAEVFQNERWSFLKQGIVHFVITAAVWMPIAWICWAPVYGKGLVFTIIGWTLTYIVNWTVQYFIWKHKVLEINRCMRAARETEGAA